MTWNKELDEILDTVVAVEGDKTRLLVDLARYDHGETKLQIRREVRTATGWTFSKLGRIRIWEFVELVPAAFRLIEKNGIASAKAINGVATFGQEGPEIIPSRFSPQQVWPLKDVADQILGRATDRPDGQIEPINQRGEEKSEK